MAENESLYPQRVSEQIESFTVPEKKLNLSDEEKDLLLKFEEPLYQEMIDLREIEDSGDHSIYPSYFLNEEGTKVFSETYLTSTNIRLADNENSAKVGDIVQAINGVDISQIDEMKRKESSRKSSNWAEEKFKLDFINAKGDITRIKNPERISFLVDPESLTGKIKSLRELKKKIKKQESGLKKETTDLSRSKVILLGMYRRLVNVMIAQRYAEAGLLANKDNLNLPERELLNYFRLPTDIEDEELRISKERMPRFMERIDHFLQGAGVELGSMGLRVTLPEKLKTYVGELIQSKKERSSEWEWVNSIEVNPDQIKTLAELMIELSGFSEGPEKWSAELTKSKGGMKCVYREKGQVVRKIKIPESENRKLGDVLVVLEHEFGHALREINRDRLGGGLKIVEDLVGGRGGALNEGVAKWIENHAKERMFGIKHSSEQYYLMAIAEKAAGGSFKECFKRFLQIYSERELGLSLKELMGNKEKFDSAFSYVYPRTLRIFRRNTPLNDDSGYVADSRQLKYLEGEILTKALEKQGLLFKYGFIKGLDLNSISDLEKLGMLDTSKILEPQFAVSEQIWPKLRLLLKRGLPIDEAIRQLDIEFTKTQ